MNSAYVQVHAAGAWDIGLRTDVPPTRVQRLVRLRLGSRFDVINQLGPSISHTLPFVVRDTKAVDSVADKPSKLNHSRCEMSNMYEIVVIELSLNAVRENPRFVVTISVRVGNGSQVIFNHRKIVRKRPATHPHEVFLVAQRVLAEFGVSLIERESAEVSPGTLGIQVAIPRIKVAFSRQRIAWVHRHLKRNR
jgi:hypothetical protein